MSTFHCGICEGEINSINPNECKDALLCDLCVKYLTRAGVLDYRKKDLKSIHYKLLGKNEINDYIDYDDYGAAIDEKLNYLFPARKSGKFSEREQIDSEDAELVGQFVCVICNNTFDAWFPSKCTEGFICKDCKHTFMKGIKYEFMDVNQIKEKIDYEKKFTTTQSIGNYVGFDDVHKLLCINPSANKNIFRYDEIESLELLKNGQTVTSGGVGGAVIGDFLLGAYGALIGSIADTRTSKNVMTSLKIRVGIKNTYEPNVYIELCSSNVYENSSKYEKLMHCAYDILTLLGRILKEQESEDTEPVTDSNANRISTNISVPEEIKKYKELLDMGAITQKEYDAKKKQLLNL